MDFVAERALRRHWKTRDAPQQAAFSTALRRSVVATYASQFAEPGAVQFATESTDRLANGDAVVHAQLAPRDRCAISLGYVLKPRGTEWQVVNVPADGVSDLALRATQYDALIKSEGFEALIARLDGQTRQLKAHCP